MQAVTRYLPPEDAVVQNRRCSPHFQRFLYVAAKQGLGVFAIERQGFDRCRGRRCWRRFGWTRRPHVLQDRYGAHSSPPTGTLRNATAATGRFRFPPGRGRVRGLGKSPSFAAQQLQYTCTPPFARYQREPQLSQIFRSTSTCIFENPPMEIGALAGLFWVASPRERGSCGARALALPACCAIQFASVSSLSRASKTSVPREKNRHCRNVSVWCW